MHLRLWALSALLVVVGVFYLFLLEESLTALLFVVAGVLVSLAFVRPRGRSSTRAADGGSADISSLEGLAGMVRGLGIEGRGVHVPTGGGVRLFLPADDRVGQDDLPQLVAEATLVRNRPGAFGVAFAPPGKALLDQWYAQVGEPRYGSAEAAAAGVRRALPELGIGRDVRVETSPGKLRIQYRHTRYAELCRTTREEWAPWDLQGGCPVCSFIASLAAASAATPLRFAKVEAAGDVISLVLEALPKKTHVAALATAR